jgi:hypothetical protein
VIVVLLHVVIVQLIVHVFSVVLHDVQPGGHAGAASARGASPFGASIAVARTQKPSPLQTRPGSQSRVVVQANPSLLWFTLQLVAMTNPSDAASPMAIPSFIARLQR